MPANLYFLQAMTWEPGKQLKARPFTIENVLGEGGFGITYKAYHAQLEQAMVLKIPNAKLQRDLQYPKFVRRFRKEAKILAKVSAEAHPGIVRAIDLFDEEELPCLVMDYVPGESLWDWVRERGALHESEAVALIRDVADALLVVHRAGIVHRDLHAGNIMLRQRGEGWQPMLIDFGIAAEIAPEVSTHAHPIHPVFAPYEQYAGSGEPTVDVYALTGSLYYAATGRAPVGGLERKLKGRRLISPKEHNPNLSDELDAIVRRGMALEPAERLHSIEELAALLAEVPCSKKTPQVSASQVSAPPAPPDRPIAASTLKILETQGKPESVRVPLKAGKTDYRKLKTLLAQQKWHEADAETLRVMCEVAGREEQEWLDPPSIRNFPCKDLQTIDRLWVQHSNGRFGFSVQRRIYQSLGGTEDYNEKTWEAFGDRVGWRQDGRWLWHDGLSFPTSVALPEGHLPAWRAKRIDGFVVGRWRWYFDVGLFCRIETCQR